MGLLEIAGLVMKYETSFPSTMEKLFSGYYVHETGKNENVPLLNPKPWIETVSNETGQGPESVEFYALSAALGEMLPVYDRLQTHGVAIEYDGKAYMFSAPSGTGKSTRAFLWQKYLGYDKVSVINGDKPVLWFNGNEVLACGSPWAGKEGLNRNVCVPLGGICLLRRSSENTIRHADAQQFFDFFMPQVQLPSAVPAKMKALSLLEELYAKVPIFMLENDMSEYGVKVSYQTLTGKEYETHRI